MASKRVYLSLALCSFLGAGCLDGFAATTGEALGNALGRGIVCATLGGFERGDLSVRAAGTERAAYLIRDDEVPNPLMRGTSGAVRVVGVSQAVTPVVKNTSVVSMSSLSPSQSADECWAMGMISARGVGKTKVDIASENKTVSVVVEVAAAKRFEIYDGEKGLVDDDVLTLTVGDRMPLRFRVLDGKARELSYLKPVAWTVSGSTSVLEWTDDFASDETQRSGSGVTTMNAEVTLVAQSEGRGRLFVAMGDERLALTIVVNAAEPADAAVDLLDSGAEDQNVSSP